MELTYLTSARWVVTKPHVNKCNYLLGSTGQQLALKHKARFPLSSFFKVFEVSLSELRNDKVSYCTSMSTHCWREWSESIAIDHRHVCRAERSGWEQAHWRSLLLEQDGLRSTRNSPMFKASTVNPPPRFPVCSDDSFGEAWVWLLRQSLQNDSESLITSYSECKRNTENIKAQNQLEKHMFKTFINPQGATTNPIRSNSA